MSPLLVALLGVLLVPLFVASWRTSLLGLASQGFLMAWIAYRMDPSLSHAGDWLTLLDLIVVRGLWAPLALYGVLRAQNAPARNDVIPPNLLSWTLALGMVLVAFNFAELMIPEYGEERTLIAVATSGLMIGFLVLSTRSGPFSQMVGALRIENAIALFELGAPRPHAGVGLQVAQIAVVALTILLFRWYLGTIGASAPAAPEPSLEGPTL